ncbi:hypothetical protein [Sporosarcina koreensis]|uniref:Flavin transferase n=1 Tax=Sporosarcina koreensis TaxID=334735 RepID=A0ABW0TWS3_9BACL
MKRTKLLYITLSFFLLLITSACNKQPDIDISETLRKTEEFFRQAEKIDATASSFDGKKDVKFRLMVEGKLTEDEAILLFNKISDSLIKYSNQSDIWNYYNGYFDIKSYDSGVIFEATKLIGEDLEAGYKQ